MNEANPVEHRAGPQPYPVRPKIGGWRGMPESMTLGDSDG